MSVVAPRRRLLRSGSSGPDRAPGSGPVGTPWHGLHKRLTPYLFVAPSAVVFTLFMFVPLAMTLVLSLRSSTGLGSSEFVGLSNYVELVQDAVFRRAMLNTVVFSLATVPTSLGLGLLLAIALNARLAGTAFFRSVFYIPVVLSGVAVGIIFVWHFNETAGVINQLLETVGLPTVRWQSSGSMAMTSLVIGEVWTRLGFCMVVYLAALQGITTDLYEASGVDGATRVQQFWKITLPLLAPSTFVLVVINVINSFRVFDLVYVMTGGGPGFATEMITTHIYNIGFAQRQQGSAAAMGVVLFVILMVFTVVYHRATQLEDQT